MVSLCVGEIVRMCGIENCGFLTLTFGDHVTDSREAGRRLNSLLTNVVRPRYKEYICVRERMKSGRIHFHLIVDAKRDIKTGLIWAEIKAKKYTSANAYLRSEWAFWRKAAKKYRFGRTELLPIRSNVEAICRYVGKYISKHIGHRIEADKGVRLVRMSKGVKVASTRFAWNSPGSWCWRKKQALLAEAFGVDNEDDLYELLGPHWAFRWGPLIRRINIRIYRDDATWQADVNMTPLEMVEARASFPEPFFLEAEYVADRIALLRVTEDRHGRAPNLLYSRVAQREQEVYGEWVFVPHSPASAPFPLAH